MASMKQEPDCLKWLNGEIQIRFNDLKLAIPSLQIHDIKNDVKQIENSKIDTELKEIKNKIMLD